MTLSEMSTIRRALRRTMCHGGHIWGQRPPHVAVCPRCDSQLRLHDAVGAWFAANGTVPDAAEWARWRQQREPGVWEHA